MGGRGIVSCVTGLPYRSAHTVRLLLGLSTLSSSPSYVYCILFLLSFLLPFPLFFFYIPSFFIFRLPYFSAIVIIVAVVLVLLPYPFLTVFVSRAVPRLWARLLNRGSTPVRDRDFSFLKRLDRLWGMLCNGYRELMPGHQAAGAGAWSSTSTRRTSSWRGA